ncbi:hypothetical protein [Escherichia phage phiWec191]|uniref:Uncharacterized protein n=2 Tax=Vequintavirus TaxID=1914852 RepID=A0ACA8S9P1_9CAUD|nr:hypothetical protein [Escherichia phage phiWec191]
MTHCRSSDSIHTSFGEYGIHNENIVRGFGGDPDDHYVHSGCCRNTHGWNMINTHASEETSKGVTICPLTEPVQEENFDSEDSPSSLQVDPEADDLTWEDIVDIWFSIMPEHEEFRGGRL